MTTRQLTLTAVLLAVCIAFQCLKSVSVYITGPAVNAGDMARLVGRYNAEGADGILILLLSYAQGQYLAHALRENCLPLALALVQPDETVGVDFGELELTVNQGIHGSQDCANALLRAGIPCEFYAGPRADGQLLTFVSDFAAAAATEERAESMAAVCAPPAPYVFKALATWLMFEPARLRLAWASRRATASTSMLGASLSLSAECLT